MQKGLRGSELAAAVLMASISSSCSSVHRNADLSLVSSLIFTVKLLTFGIYLAKVLKSPTSDLTSFFMQVMGSPTELRGGLERGDDHLTILVGLQSKTTELHRGRYPEFLVRKYPPTHYHI